MRNFRLLKADEIECRISQVTDNGVGILLYKTARTDYQLLDETVGMYNWQNDYKVIDGKMYCGIGIFEAISKTWAWKWNCGTESNTEAEKGQASDAMKRAGFAWGIGTELYSAPFIWIENSLLQKRSGNKVYDKFYVTSIGYDDNQDINQLQIKNDRGMVVFTHPRTKRETAENPPVQAAAQRKVNTPPDTSKASSKAVCVECGAEVSEKVRAYSMNKFHNVYCMDCQKRYGR